MKNDIRSTVVWVCLVLIASCVLSAHAAISPGSIAGLWLFDENSGTVAKDESGNGNDGELMGNASWTAGVSGSAVAFDGAVGSIVSIADSDSLDMSNGLTVMLWFRTGKKMVDMWGDRQIVIGKHYTEYELGIYTQGQLHTYTASSAADYDEGIMTTIDGKLPDGDSDWAVDKWYHLAWTLDGTHEVAYVNGVMLDEFDKATANTKAGTHPLEIGERQGGSLPLTGVVDEVAVFNVALSQKDVQAAYEDGLAVATGIGTAVEPTGKLATAWGAMKSQ